MPKRFSFLMQQTAPPAVRQPETGPGSGEIRMPKILLVEDNEMNRDMLSRRLQRKGYSVVTAEDGEKGLVLARSEAPDLILMDISLPALDGWEATRVLKANKSTRHSHII